MGEVHVAVEVSDKALELADTDGSALFAHNAIAFALTLVSADTTADSRKIAAAVDNGHCIAHVSLRELVNPVGDIIAHRATLLALGHLAVETALGFGYSLNHCERLGSGCLKLVFHQ